MIEVLKQALDALETEVFIDWTNNDEFNASAEKMHDAIASLQQAIAELESQEPVALPCCGYANAEAVKWNPYNQVVQCHNCGQVYTPQRQQEPVAWRGYNWSHSPDDWVYRDFDDPILDGKGNNVGQPLYTSPPKHEPCPYVVSTREGTHHCALSQRQPLTDEQISAIDWKQNETLHDFARAIEAAHGIKGEA